VDLHGLQGENLPHHGLHHELQGKTLCSGISSTSSPLLVHWLCCLQSCFSHVVSLLPPAAIAVAQQFPPTHLCYHRGSTTITDGFGLGQWQVHLGPGCHWLHRWWGKLLEDSHRNHPCSPPATKILPCKPNTARSDSKPIAFTRLMVQRSPIFSNPYVSSILMQ